MIDKIWYDWQHKNAANGNTFTGGSVQDASSPTGIAPMLTVGLTYSYACSNIN